jgi:hypothetical protein
MSGDAPTANETIATVMAANAPAPRPCLKVLPVVCSTQNDLRTYVFTLTKPQFPRLSLGCVRINTKAEPLSRNHKQASGRVRRLAISVGL